MFKRSICIVLFFLSGRLQSESLFNVLYPYTSFKSIVDTCMRSYTDVLHIQDRIYCNEKIDEQVDLLVGRLMRLKSYIDQAIYAYRFEATVTYDELEYLMKMLDYLEITISEQHYKQVYTSLNVLIADFKKQIRQALEVQIAWAIPQFKWSPFQCALGRAMHFSCGVTLVSDRSFRAKASA